MRVPTVLGARPAARTLSRPQCRSLRQSRAPMHSRPWCGSQAGQPFPTLRKIPPTNKRDHAYPVWNLWSWPSSAGQKCGAPAPSDSWSQIALTGKMWSSPSGSQQMLILPLNAAEGRNIRNCPPSSVASALGSFHLLHCRCRLWQSGSERVEASPLPRRPTYKPG